MAGFGAEPQGFNLLTFHLISGMMSVMDSFFFTFNAILPLITLVLLGYILRRIGLITAAWAAAANKLSFRTFLPVLFFINIYSTDSLADIDLTLTVYTVSGIILAFGLGFLAQAIFVRDPRQKGVVWQGIYRSNFAILGMPLAISLFGPEGGQTAALLSLFVVPLFNILAVISLYGCENHGKSSSLKGQLKTMVNNPLVIGAFVGFVALLLRQLNPAIALSRLPFILSAATSMSQAATPLMLVSLGAGFTFTSARGLIKPLMICLLMRNIIVPILILTPAFLFFPAFHGAPFAALIAIFASPVAIVATVMAIEMGGDKDLSGQILFWTTASAALTIFLFVFIFKTLGALS